MTNEATPTTVHVQQSASTGCLKWMLILLCLLALSPFILFGGGCAAIAGMAAVGATLEEDQPAEEPSGETSLGSHDDEGR